MTKSHIAQYFRYQADMEMLSQDIDRMLVDNLLDVASSIDRAKEIQLQPSDLDLLLVDRPHGEDVVSMENSLSKDILIRLPLAHKDTMPNWIGVSISIDSEVSFARVIVNCLTLGGTEYAVLAGAAMTEYPGGGGLLPSFAPYLGQANEVLLFSALKLSVAYLTQNYPPLVG